MEIVEKHFCKKEKRYRIFFAVISFARGVPPTPDKAPRLPAGLARPVFPRPLAGVASPGLGRVDFCRCPGVGHLLSYPPGSPKRFPPGFARLDRSPGSGSVSVGQTPAPAGGSPGLSLSEKSYLLLFFWGKT